MFLDGKGTAEKVKMSDAESKIIAKVEVLLEYEGKTLVDKTVANILRIIDEYGSLLAAARMLSIPYSRVWERIYKIEKILGEEIIERKKERKQGVTLTKLGKTLLNIYVKKCLEHNIPIDWKAPLKENKIKNKIIFMGSHDPLIESILQDIERTVNVKISICWTGSKIGIDSLYRGEATLTASHWYDPKTREYNLPLLRNLKSVKFTIFRGLEREIGLAFSPKLPIREISELFSGKYKIANRNKGSGTRNYVEELLRDFKVKKIPGLETEFPTHYDVARSIALGNADFGVTPRYIAELYDLKFLPLRWEFFDFITIADYLDNVAPLMKQIEGKLLALIKKDRGYRLKAGKLSILEI